MKCAIRLSAALTVVLLLIGAAPELQAVQTTAGVAATPQPTEVDLEIKQMIAEGDQAAAIGSWGTARRHYEDAADLAREHNQLPSAAMRRIANSYYYQHRYQSAGKVLEELAKASAAYGDLRCQAWALADAAWIAGVAGDKIDMQRRLTRLDRLLTSPFLPADVKNEVVQKRLAGISTTETLASLPKK